MFGTAPFCTSTSRPALILLSLLAAALGAAACASPRVSESLASTPPVIDAHGVTASTQRAERLLDQRLEFQADNEPVRELIDAFRAQSQTPLVAGNRVSLLIDGPQTLNAIQRAIEGAAASRAR